MSGYDEDPWAEEEAAQNVRWDADLEMADMAAAGDAIAAARKAGRCAHQSAVGYAPKGHRHYPEQEGLKRGQVRCTDGCGRVFASDEDWYAAMDEAVAG